MVNHTISPSNKLKEPKTASSKAPIDLNDSLCRKIEQLIEKLKNSAETNVKQDQIQDQNIFGQTKTLEKQG